MSVDELDKRLERIKRVIPFDAILDRDVADAHAIARYYRLNRLAYKLINSKQGFVHMGISRDGTFKEADFLEHANLVAGYIKAVEAHDILELAAGKGATTKFLAAQHPGLSFTGLDLPNGQMALSSGGLQNLSFTEGDYHDLSQFAPNSFGIVYIIEALCHARDKETVIREVRRVLKPGGAFIIFDGYCSKSWEDMTEKEKLISSLIYKSMMVPEKGHAYSHLQEQLHAAGFALAKEENLSSYVLPSMERLERVAAKYFRHPILAGALNKVMPLEITGNAAAGYLMPLSVHLGLHQYWVTVATKE